ncbi:MAG: hypothetical protein NWE93_02800 [Candidatus Bathyarchaeota archaeon]|nr:hypothetical protein [Candidatus Bathyarchaeota archaeon]
MSIELPEAYLLSDQMNHELAGRQVAAAQIRNCTSYQNLGFINTYLSDFQRLCGGKIQSVASRGNTIRVKLDNTLNLLLAPEYGGYILFHPQGKDAPAKYHLKLDFADQSFLTVTLTGMGVIKALTDEELSASYLYRRDFSSTASPLDTDFTSELFAARLAEKNVNLKAALVGKDAVVVGLGNSAFMDIVFRAGIHPKRKASELTVAEMQSLFNAVKMLVTQRTLLGGKNQFLDLYGRQGGYVPAMGANMKGRACPACGGEVAKLGLGGGQVYLCPTCQK